MSPITIKKLQLLTATALVMSAMATSAWATEDNCNQASCTIKNEGKDTGGGGGFGGGSGPTGGGGFGAGSSSSTDPSLGAPNGGFNGGSGNTTAGGAPNGGFNGGSGPDNGGGFNGGSGPTTAGGSPNGGFNGGSGPGTSSEYNRSYQHGQTAALNGEIGPNNHPMYDSHGNKVGNVLEFDVRRPDGGFDHVVERSNLKTKENVVTIHHSRSATSRDGTPIAYTPQKGPGSITTTKKDGTTTTTTLHPQATAAQISTGAAKRAAIKADPALLAAAQAAAKAKASAPSAPHVVSSTSSKPKVAIAPPPVVKPKPPTPTQPVFSSTMMRAPSPSR